MKSFVNLFKGCGVQERVALEAAFLFVNFFFAPVWSKKKWLRLLLDRTRSDGVSFRRNVVSFVQKISPRFTAQTAVKHGDIFIFCVGYGFTLPVPRAVPPVIAERSLVQQGDTDDLLLLL